jgi:stringent starvation protein A
MGVSARRSGMTLFSDPACHYSHRVRIVLAEKGITVDIEDVDPSAVPTEVLEFSPYGTLPTLVDRELALYETKVMMEYLDERFPHPPLLPVYPVARALSRQFMYRIEKDWCGDVNQILSQPDAKDTDKARKRLRENLLSIAPIFSEMPYFMNEEFTLVDCCLAPLLWRLEILGIKLPNNRQIKPMLAYMQTLFERPAFRLSLSDLEREMR